MHLCAINNLLKQGGIFFTNIIRKMAKVPKTLDQWDALLREERAAPQDTVAQRLADDAKALRDGAALQQAQEEVLAIQARPALEGASPNQKVNESE